MPGEDDTNYKTDDYCGLYLGNASTVPLCVQICVIIDTRWDHELKHEWVLIRRSLSMSSIVQNTLLLQRRSEESELQTRLHRVTRPMQSRVDNDRLFFFFFDPIPPRIAPRCPIGNVKRGSLYAAILILLSSLCTMTSMEETSLFSPKETIRGAGKG